MKSCVLIIICLLYSSSNFSQSTTTNSLIEAAENHLKDSVGAELMNFFRFSDNSFYRYYTRTGKIKLKRVVPGRKIKGSFDSGDFRFDFIHPEFAKLGVSNTFTVNLNSDLELYSSINKERIPGFIFNNEPYNWLTPKELDRVIASQNLKPSEHSLKKEILFDSKLKRYYWYIENTLSKEKCFINYEILKVDPKTGEVLEHEENTELILHCN